MNLDNLFLLKLLLQDEVRSCNHLAAAVRSFFMRLEHQLSVARLPY